MATPAPESSYGRIHGLHDEVVGTVAAQDILTASGPTASRALAGRESLSSQSVPVSVPLRAGRPGDGAATETTRLDRLESGARGLQLSRGRVVCGAVLTDHVLGYLDGQVGWWSLSWASRSRRVAV